MYSGRQFVRLIALALAVLLALPSHRTFAKDSGESEVARTERAKGTVALNLGQYDEAIDHFSQAYTLTQDPILLFNLGQAFRLAGRPDKAVASYSSFLRAAGQGTKYRTQFERAAVEIETITPTLVCPTKGRVAAGKQPDDIAQPDESVSAPAPTAKRAAAPTPAPPPVEPDTKENAVAPPPLAPLVAPVLAPSPPPATAPALALTAKAASPIESESTPVYKKMWFWSTVVAVVAIGGAATWYFTRSQNQTPGSTYGSTRVLP